ncbi:MAG: sulfotransferase [Cyanobacteria bacterium HKST-UBA04]|nr:sulfotransferase [Cyanobacteria bacterium HKST-UBA04]
MVSPDSPEAFEEMIWMQFFGHLHQTSQSVVLGADDCYPAFEAFYRAHMHQWPKRVGASRYLAKNNYLVSRLAYLVRRFDQARVIVMVRDPVAHVASMIKQQRLFTQGLRHNPAGIRYLRRVGHYEFGPLRQAIHLTDAEAVARIEAAWASGDEVLGWAQYWAMVYGYLAHLLATDDWLQARCMVVWYETLCNQPQQTLEAMLAFCRLPLASYPLEAMAASMAAPTYYRPDFNEAALACIRQQTSAVVERLGALNTTGTTDATGAMGAMDVQVL